MNEDEAPEPDDYDCNPEPLASPSSEMRMKLTDTVLTSQRLGITLQATAA